MPCISFSASGSIGNSVTFQKTLSGFSLKRIGIPPRRKSFYQFFFNHAYSLAVHDWQLSPLSFQDIFNSYASGKTQSGWNTFLQYFVFIFQSSKFGEAKFGWSKFY